jgi:hypothetical protein
MLEMKQVLGALVERLDVQPSRAESERVRRRQITLAPSRGGEVVVA